MSVFDADIEKFRKSLGLHLWDITLKSDDSFDRTYGEDAYVMKRDDERIAVIYVNPFIIDTRRYLFLIAHEMVHILLSDMEFIACNGRSTDIMDIFNRELERVVNAIANMLVEP